MGRGGGWVQLREYPREFMLTLQVELQSVTTE